ncbi:hypothetical protein B0H65DRAFT_511056 [Neurospora tetraspora]|uniref:Uncharacterized protein n=1 Tax=Neurospora tetraspora TaxID=94610 RepID=A0AAE0JBM4_9PEZI|nr:hypothetical protein B0H65DRAFT_511056 [Neurospora tetraspora]
MDRVLDALLELCRNRGYLDHPVGLSNEDVRDGLNDETTLLWSPQACSLRKPKKSAPQSMQQQHMTPSASPTLKIPRTWYVRPVNMSLGKMKKEILETNGRESEANPPSEPPISVYPYGGGLNIKPVDFATQLCPGISQAIKWEGTSLREIPAGPTKFIIDEQGGKIRKELVARLP